MSSEERQQILKMVEDGKISAEEAVTLMKALDETVEVEEEVFQTEADQGSSKSEAPELERTAERARPFLWQIPLWIGVILTVFTAWGMYAIQQSAGYNFWFYCLTMWLMVGVAVIALAGWSRTARWLFVNVEQHARRWASPHHFGISASRSDWRVGSCVISVITSKGFATPMWMMSLKRYPWQPRQQMARL